MSVALACFSHSPLQLGYVPPADRAAHDGWQLALDGLAGWVGDYDPELVVVFYPDHFNGFFYRSMPSFCIGTEARGGIDWGGQPGPLDVPGDIARDCIAAVRNAGIDVAVSHRMLVDHGVTLPLKLFCGGVAARPSLPIMVNCNAPPYPSFARVRLLGEAVGRFLAGLGKRVLVVGSGGLSHDPPNAGPAMFADGLPERLIEGGECTEADYDRRQARVIQAGCDLAAGGSPCLAPDAGWDMAFMETLERGELDAYDDAEDDALSAVGGVGVHEVRTWTAAFAAMRAAGRYEATIDCYFAVPEWLTGMGIMRAEAADA
ncbi:MAG: 3-carboxyethylcatechol 2,3-dioxygenase [Defluviicoccus sp.]|nr:3-carboxyethylcatechol 2,3-dioxygenase [Defluviicoccus sp.]MDE0385166.1 3-carboxyethylcatechol 2,3-dioxygenase [Defluviicoccus sp.]